jgi:hypothetical protein
MWTTASHSPSCPAHTWSDPAVVWTSCFTIASMALAVILRRVSAMPIGQTPGFLFRGASLHAVKAWRPNGSTHVVASLRAKLDIAILRARHPWMNSIDNTNRLRQRWWHSLPRLALAKERALSKSCALGHLACNASRTDSPESRVSSRVYISSHDQRGSVKPHKLFLPAWDERKLWQACRQYLDAGWFLAAVG